VESHRKVVDRAALPSALSPWRARGARIVFTNGCFDLLHAGHVEYLYAAKRAGDVLVVGLNSDASVRRAKGRGRPIVPVEDRADLLGALEMVDIVSVFEEDTPLALIRIVRPAVLVKGADWAPEAVVGREEVEADGGRLLLVPLRAGLSTTELVRRLAQPGPR
jgi:D-beta-D-heptose 7-phosphate kinase/D-beta-D-heptose 1-phosphate adenosyltransferase